MNVQLDVAGAKEKMLAIVKEDEPGTKYTRDTLIKKLLNNSDFQYTEAEQAFNKLFFEKKLHFNVDGFITTEEAPQSA